MKKGTTKRGLKNWFLYEGGTAVLIRAASWYEAIDAAGSLEQGYLRQERPPCVKENHDWKPYSNWENKIIEVCANCGLRKVNVPHGQYYEEAV